MNKTETPLRNRSKNNDIEKEELENNPAVKGGRSEFCVTLI